MDKLSIAVGGMKIDQVFWQRKQGELSYAMNANLQSFDGNQLTYTNEPSNQLCNTFPAGFIVIGTHLVLSRNEVIFALVNPITGQSKLSRITNANCNSLTSENVEYNCSCQDGKILSSTVNITIPCCIYSPIVESSCLNFNIDHPVRMVDKQTNCGYKLYLDDDYNPSRYIDLDDPNGVDGCNIPFDEFSCDRIKIFKDFCIPEIIASSVEAGGNLQAGTYQALIAYTDISGNEYTDYFQATNPLPIFDRKITVDTDYFTGKSIKFKITHNTDIFDYFKLVIIKTVNEVADYIEEGVHKVSSPNFVTYTGNELVKVRTTLEKLRIPSPSYTKAKFIVESSDHLIHADLEGDPEYNFQPFASKLKLYWETVKIPYNQLNNYTNPIVASRFKTYQRDEVYPWGIRLKLKNGKKTKAHLLIGRASVSFDRTLAGINSPDNIITRDCDGKLLPSKRKWEVFNTASKFPGFFTPIVAPNEERICDIAPYERGEFSYWESTETYPCDERIWGDLAGKPIRYHKFPDSAITHIHDGWGVDLNKEADFTNNSPSFYDFNHSSFIFPIGVRLDEGLFNAALNDTLIFNPVTGVEDIPIRDLICGFEIVRGNRVGHKSIIAKGLFFDVGEFKETNDAGDIIKKQYYPNYPYNDLYPDHFLSKNVSIYNTSDPQPGSDPNRTPDIEGMYRVDGFADSERRRFTFHSPDTHFQHPTLGTEIKLETEEFGVARGHFVGVEDHPKYKFLTKFDSVLATALGLAASIDVQNETEDEFDVSITGGVRQRRKGKTDINYATLIGTANVVKDTIEKLIPWRNFAFQYNSTGIYNNYVPILNNYNISNPRWKRRAIEHAQYLSPNIQNVDDINPVNNFQRESSVYLRTSSKTFFPYYRDEHSRFTLSSAGDGMLTSESEWCKYPGRERDSRIRSYYGSIKRQVPDQYGNIDNLRFVTTGYEITLQDGQFVNTYYPIFGGDTFIGREAFKIKMPFFNQNIVGRPDGIDFDYNLVPNLAYPTYYIGTSPDELKLNEVVTGANVAELVAGLLLSVGATATAGTVAQFLNFLAMVDLIAFGTTIYLKILSGFIPKNNLDCDTTPDTLAAGLGVTFRDVHFGIDLPGDGADIDINFKVPDGFTFLSEGLSGQTIFYQSGKFYLAAYGVPQYFVESDINLELRHGTNLLEENFYPNVSGGIPDDWLQEKNVPIKHDNKYHYNATYSIQNSQDYIIAFNNYKFDKLCQSDFPNRLIYSEKSNNEENFDNWLKYRASNYYDFDKSNGVITGIDSLENNKIIVRFENTFQIFNTRITLQSNSPYEVAISNSGMFTQDPIEFSKTNTGNAGSQHIAFEQTPHGSFWTDAKRGEVYQFNQDSLNEISRTNYNWFKEHLPFNIIKDFPEFKIDNSYKDIGLSICWDERNERLFITKNDFKITPAFKGRVYQEGNSLVYLDVDVVKIAEFSNAEIFENRSWTIAWSPLINNWVSFYSFLPNYYVSHPTHFQTGIHNSIWNHNLSNLSYQTYYNVLYPYILEIPISNIPQTEILKAVTINTDIQRYISEADYYSLKSINKENYNIFFNKAIIYNKEQSSGLLTLTETPINDMRSRISFPKYNTDNINILYSKYNKVCTFNSFYDITKNYENQQPVFTTEWGQLQAFYPIDKVLNIDNANYRNTNKKMAIKSNECYVRLIQDVHQRYKFTNIFEILNQEENKNQR